MQLSNYLLAALVPLSIAHPLKKRWYSGALPPIDSQVDENTVQLALYLEHLEFALYSGGYDTFSDAQFNASGFPAGFRDNVGVIAQHEATHAASLSSILVKAGKTPVPTCSYQFPYNSPTSFVDLANMITSVGIGAYLGGGVQIRDDPELLAAASSILTVEARHDAYLRAGVGGSPFPNAFDTSLTAAFAYSLAQAFIVKCPQQLPIPILPKLTLTSPPPKPNLQPPTPAGTQLDFSFNPDECNIDQSKPLYIALINSATNLTYIEVQDDGSGKVSIPVPQGAAGAAFAVLTNQYEDNEDKLSQSAALAGPAEIILS